jgi:hypothetical protein
MHCQFEMNVDMEGMFFGPKKPTTKKPSLEPSNAAGLSGDHQNLKVFWRDTLW